MCDCGQPAPFEDCCKPYLDGERLPATAEQLMRSRYSAYARANIDYIQKTCAGPARAHFNPTGARNWAKRCQWVSLEVLNTRAGQVHDPQGWVEFIARYKDKKGEHVLHELSEFHAIDGRWYYVDGQHFN